MTSFSVMPEKIHSTEGPDKDSLWGGAGNDIFDFNSVSDSVAGNADIVFDSSTAEQNEVNLATIDANSLVSSNQTFQFIGSLAFTAVAGQLRYDGAMILGDTNGDMVADFATQLQGVASLALSDFVL